MEEGITRHEQTTSALELDEFDSNRKNQGTFIFNERKAIADILQIR